MGVTTADVPCSSKTLLLVPADHCHHISIIVASMLSLGFSLLHGVCCPPSLLLLLPCS